MSINKGKIAIVTGATGGIGFEVAKRLGKDGFTVILNGIFHEDGAKRVAELKSEGINAEYYGFDVTDENAVTSNIKAIGNKYGKIDVLVNNAGGLGGRSRFEEMTTEFYRKVMALNLDSVFFGCKYSIPLMRDSGNGSIINISSISGIVAGHNFAAYNSAKAAVRHLTKSVALHCARTTDLVRCNSVHPVFAKTEMMKSFFENPTDELISKIERQIPVRKLVTVKDVANSILFLASDESKMITGSEIVIDGGLSAQ